MRTYTHHLDIDSSIRTEEESSTEFRIKNLNLKWLQTTRKVAHLRWVQIPLTHYLITSENNKIFANVNSQPFARCYLESGSFSGAALAENLQKSLNTWAGSIYLTVLDAEFAVVYNPNDFRFTISTVSKSDTSISLPIDFSIKWFDGPSRSIAPYFGFSYDITHANGTMISANIARVTGGIDRLAIVIQESRTNRRRGSFIIPLNEKNGAIMTWEPTHSPSIELERNTTEFNVSLTDMNGQVIDLNGSDWFASLQIEEFIEF